ncbi:MAG: AEC family transporter [Deltaproteobacteria bacterium]|jgi:predicted permease|nr:AEC family transporter [Deltaproteobacteria bacterium]
MIDLTVVWHSLESVLTLFLISFVGFALARARWFSPETTILLPRLVMVVALPPYMLYNITHFMTREELGRLAYGVVIPFISILLCFGVGALMARLFKVERKRYGIFCSGVAFSNTIFIGLPVNLALFGESAVPYVLLYYFANTTLFWTIGNYFMARDGEGAQIRLVSRKTLKRVISPPMLGLIAGVLLLESGLTLPGFIAEAARGLGGLTTPLALMILGITMQGVSARQLRLDREQAGILFGRLVVSPLSVVLLSRVFPLPDLMFKVFIIQASLPCAASLAMLASFYKSDPEFSALAVSLTTLAAILSIPLFMLLLTRF